MSVGGINIFDDSCLNNERPKPWKNTDPKVYLFILNIYIVCKFANSLFVFILGPVTFLASQEFLGTYME